ncbi:MAG: histidine phosphatase family protein [Rhodospirillaceae bacterium]
MDIIFGRHGNTFGPGDKVVWVGRETDLPLVDTGRQQARAFGAALVRLGLAPDRVFSASLARTRGFAEMVSEAQTRWRQPVIDRRLDEVHYGAWAGKTSEEIAASPGGAAAAEAWSQRDIFPADAGWGSTESEIMGNIRGFIDEVLLTAGPRETLLVVSSNGILRFFPRLLAVTNPDRPSHVMKTGHAGLISGEPGAFRVRFWNVAAEALSREHLV